MAYTGFVEDFSADKPRQGVFRRAIARLLSEPKAMTGGPETPRKLAGPVPGDKRAQGYMADLDMEAGF